MGRRAAMSWLAWVAIGMIALNTVFFGVLYVAYLMDERDWRRRK